MDLLSFILTADPMKVRVGERQRADGEPRLLETTVGRGVPLLPVAPARTSGELEVSVDKLFDEGVVKPSRKVKPPNAQVVQDVEAWKHSDFLCHNYVLNDIWNVTSDIKGSAPELALKKEPILNYAVRRCFEAFRNLMCHNYVLYGLNDIKTEAMRESDLRKKKKKNKHCEYEEEEQTTVLKKKKKEAKERLRYR
ncbi:hypothetical protein Tco_0845760, partial [Tanacetum coccineum]